MKIRSLLLGSVAAAGLATGAHAADLGVLTSLDVCDSLGISGLTISSDSNCLQITGGISYTAAWGDYRSAANYFQGPFFPYGDADDGNMDFPVQGNAGAAGHPGNSHDWESKIEAWLTATATANSDFGPAKGVITLRQVSRYRTRDEGYTSTDINGGPDADGYFGQGINDDSTDGVVLSEAYVSVGDGTVLTAGLLENGAGDSVVNIGDDAPFNYLGLFGSQTALTGALFKDDADIFGGASIQLRSDLGNGVMVGVGLENIDNNGHNGYGAADGIPATFYGGPVIGTADITNSAYSGTLIGTVNYAGDSITAHLSGGAIGVLDGDVDSWFAHAGATGTFDAFKVRAAVAYLRDDTFGQDTDFWHAILSGSATFDMFTIALSGEYKSTTIGDDTDNGWGIGGSIGAAVTDGVSVNLGARWFHDDATDMGAPIPGFGATGHWGEETDAWQVEAQVVAAVTETIKVTGAVGVYGGDVLEDSLDANPDLSGDDTAYYGSLGLAWNPGGGFTSSIVGLATSEGAYKATFNASKTFE